MKVKISEIAQLLGGIVEGNADAVVSKIAKIEEGSEGSLSFLANPAYAPHIYTSNATAIIVNQDFKAENSIKPTLIRVENAYLSFVKLLEYYKEVQMNKTGISEFAFISKSVKYGNDVYIGEFCFIGENVKIGNNTKIYPQTYIGDNCEIGDNTTIFPGVKIYSDNVIGNYCTIHAGAVLGADGFGFVPNSENNYKKITQIGNVVVEDYVEIGANTCIDRATLGSTTLKKGVKLDNLIQVAHNVSIGENTVMAAQVGISGSTKVGKNCMVGGQVGMAGHLVVEDEVKMAAQAGVASNVKKGSSILGSPAIPAVEFKRIFIHTRNIGKLVERINELEKKLEEIIKEK